MGIEIWLGYSYVPGKVRNLHGPYHNNMVLARFAMVLAPGPGPFSDGSINKFREFGQGLVVVVLALRFGLLP